MLSTYNITSTHRTTKHVFCECMFCFNFIYENASKFDKKNLILKLLLYLIQEEKCTVIKKYNCFDIIEIKQNVVKMFGSLEWLLYFLLILFMVILYAINFGEQALPRIKVKLKII